MGCLARQAAYYQDAAAEQHWKNQLGRTPHIVSRAVCTNAAVAFTRFFAQVVLTARCGAVNEPAAWNRPDATRAQIRCGKYSVAISP